MKSRPDFAQSKNFISLASSLFPHHEELEAFSLAMRSGRAQQPAIIWLYEKLRDGGIPILPPCPWQPEFVDQIPAEFPAGSHSLHEQGAYYCLDMSSVFQAASALSIPLNCETVLDVCASPGGKSIFLSKLFQPRTLMSNEVIRKRLGALVSNLERCHVESRVMSVDVEKLVHRLENACDLVFVDAPCSGQSLIARGRKAPSCFHPVTMNMNSNRQKRILAHSGQIVGSRGYLIYSTCTFSLEENEQVVAWFLRKFPDFKTVEQPCLNAFRSPHTDEYCYRLYPHQGFGAGGFTCLLNR